MATTTPDCRSCTTCRLASMGSSMIATAYSGSSREIRARKTPKPAPYWLTRRAASMDDRSAAEQIDDIIKKSSDWRGTTLSQLRALIKEADPTVVEEMKWKKPS